MAPNYSATAPNWGPSIVYVVTNTCATGTTGTLTVAEYWERIIPISVTPTIWDWPELKVSGPAWERWFDVWRLHAMPTIPKKYTAQQSLRRAAARHCIKDARRWKRRRFVQRLAAAQTKGPT